MFLKILSSRTPVSLRKITTDRRILAHYNMQCPDDRHPKLKIYISKLISDNYEYVPVAYVAMRCMI